METGSYPIRYGGPSVDDESGINSVAFRIGFKGKGENFGLRVRIDNQDFRLGQALGAPLAAD